MVNQLRKFILPLCGVYFVPNAAVLVLKDHLDLFCKLIDTDCLRDVLVAEVMEVALLLRATQNTPILRLHPALCHQVQLRLHIYGLHLGVIVIICGETETKRAKNSLAYRRTIDSVHAIKQKNITRCSYLSLVEVE